MKVTFGINNYNRLFYLRSCAESLMESVSDYEDVEFLCVDDNSKENGTEEYLQSLKDRGWKVINQQDYRNDEKLRIGQNDSDHITHFADALNIIFQESTGDIIFPLQGDCQFIRKNWLQDYVELFRQNDNVGSVLLDCQRRVRLKNATFTKTPINDTFFALDSTRKNVNGAGDCAYRRLVIDAVGGWKTPTGGGNAEVDLSDKIDSAFKGRLKTYLPWIPVCVGIFTDPRGTNARVRGNKRFGKYWKAKDDLYYEWINIESLIPHENRPLSIEEMAKTTGWDAPVDQFGNWKKNPIDITRASSEEYEIIFETDEPEELKQEDDDYITDWLVE